MSQNEPSQGQDQPNDHYVQHQDGNENNNTHQNSAAEDQQILAQLDNYDSRPYGSDVKALEDGKLDYTLEVDDNGAHRKQSQDSRLNTPLREALMEKKEDINQSISTSAMVSILLKGAFPTIIQLFSFQFINTTTLHFAGLQKDTTFYNGVGLTLTALNTFVLQIVMSLDIGLIVTGAQAFGHKKYKLIGYYYHRTIVLHIIIQLIVYFTLNFSGPVFKMIGFKEDEVNIALEFIKYSPGMILGNILFDTVKSFLNSQAVFVPQVIVQVIMAIIHWFSCKILIPAYQAKGVAFAYTITEIAGSIMLIIIAHYSNSINRESWVKWSKESFVNIWPMCKALCKVGIMVYLELVVFQVLLFASGLLGPANMGGLLTFNNMDACFFVFPMGLSIPITSYVGIFIGEMNRNKLKTLLMVASVLAIIGLIIMDAIFVFFKEQIFHFYTGDPQILAVMEKMATIYPFYLPCDFLQAQFTSVLKGAGKENIGTVIIFFAYYMVALPVGLTLAFKGGMGSFGIWIGIFAALVTIMLMASISILRINWKVQMKECFKRMSVLEGRRDMSIDKEMRNISYLLSSKSQLLKPNLLE